MTGPFLPRPFPDHHDAFECDSNGHLRGQEVRLLITYVSWPWPRTCLYILAGRKEEGERCTVSDIESTPIKRGKGKAKVPFVCKRFHPYSSMHTPYCGIAAQ